MDEDTEVLGNVCPSRVSCGRGLVARDPRAQRWGPYCGVGAADPTCISKAPFHPIGNTEPTQGGSVIQGHLALLEPRARCRAVPSSSSLSFLVIGYGAGSPRNWRGPPLPCVCGCPSGGIRGSLWSLSPARALPQTVLPFECVSLHGK